MMANTEFMKNAYTDTDLQFIRDNYLVMTDAELAEVLGRTPGAIAIRRSEMRLFRQEPRQRKRREAQYRFVNWQPSYISNGMTNELWIKVEMMKRRNGTYANPKYSSGVK